MYIQVLLCMMLSGYNAGVTYKYVMLYIVSKGRIVYHTMYVCICTSFNMRMCTEI